MDALEILTYPQKSSRSEIKNAVLEIAERRRVVNLSGTDVVRKQVCTQIFDSIIQALKKMDN